MSPRIKPHIELSTKITKHNDRLKITIYFSFFDMYHMLPNILFFI